MASILVVAAFLMGAVATYGLLHSHRLYLAAQGDAELSQAAALRFSSQGIPGDLDSQLAGLDERRALLGEAGWWRQTSLFLTIWVVVFAGAAYLARSIREDLEPEESAAR